MITGTQIRMARSALRWSASDLASACDVAERTIIRIEAADGIPKSRTDTIMAIQSALETAGIEFIGDAGEGPGVRLWAKPNQS